jgi:hypothetical protein
LGSLFGASEPAVAPPPLDVLAKQWDKVAKLERPDFSLCSPPYMHFARPGPRFYLPHEAERKWDQVVIDNFLRG